jgi:hypothetical protein
MRRENFRKHINDNPSHNTLSPLALTLKQHGVAAIKLSLLDKQIINQQLHELIEILRGKQKKPRKKKMQPIWRLLLSKGFKIAYFAHENQRLHRDLYVSEDEAPELFNSLRRILGHEGVLDGVGEYLGRSIDVQFLRLTLRDINCDGKKPFADLKHISPRTSLMHIDHVWTVKCLLYLDEVKEQNGPFCYCLGSHKVHIGWLESQIRRANDRALLSSPLARWRRLFYALPVMFQKKAKFGNDLMENLPDVDKLLESEKCFTSHHGDLIVFDDKGIHRGGLVDEGSRWALQIRLE